MKIAMVSGRSYPATGGVEKNAWEIAKRLALKGHEVHLLTSNVLSANPRRELPLGLELVESVRVLRNRSFSSPVLPEQIGVITPSTPALVAAGINRHEWDIVHAHGYGFFPAYSVAISKLLSRFPLVVTAHTTAGASGPRWMYDATLGRIVRSSADAIICASELDRKLFLNLGLTSAKLHIIPSGVDLRAFDRATSSENFRLKYGVSADFVLYVGRLSKNKGLHCLLQAMSQVFKQYPDVSLVLVGEDHGELASLLSDCERFDIRKRVVFTGRLSDNDIVDAFRACRIFVLPSLYGEAQGIVLIEAMAAGKGIVASRVGGIPMFIEDGKNGILVSPGSSTQLAAAISALLADSMQSATMGRRNQEAAKEYDWSAIANKVEAVYGHVI